MKSLKNLKGLFKNRKGGFATIVVIVIVVVIAVALINTSIKPMKGKIENTSSSANEKIEDMTDKYLGDEDATEDK